LFGLATALTYLLIPLAILGARDLRYADAMQQLWERPQPGARLMAVLVGLLFLGPAAISLLHRLAGILGWIVAPLLHVWRVWRRRTILAGRRGGQACAVPPTSRPQPTSGC